MKKSKNKNLKLKDVLKELLKMETIVENSISDIIKVIKYNDNNLSQEIIERDNIIDDLKQRIEKYVVLLISKKDLDEIHLRELIVILKIVTDLERISDHCTDIAKYILLINEENISNDNDDIIEMALVVEKMFGMALDAYVEGDLDKAKLVCNEDDVVDEYFDNLLLKFEKNIKIDNDFTKYGIYYILIIRYLERMADHITNICEWIIFKISGKYKEYN